ncbi:hypothetical protein ILUMI_09577 [Ignelater luminosus]|uniref:Retroviral polymerase SH3-like domain-containing protein n=1 Tax=Ignelater luminosus TaxID=2038154 RepID=A0A8K0GEX5_IGNLU|nr:hypothetical protein ILUMI_09577 [Ignelater luminosus]
MSKCMLLEANLKKEFWREAIRTANYLQNRLPTSGKNKTSYELWYGEKPNIGHLRTFGSTAYTLIPRVRRPKLDDNSKKVIFVEYESGSKYRLFYRCTKNIVISSNVHFKQHFHEEKCIAKFKNQEDIDVGILNKGNSKTEDVLGKETDKAKEKLQMDVEERAIEVEQPLERRISKRTTKGKPPIRFENVNYNRKIEVEQQTYEDAVQYQESKQLINAMEEEMKSLKEKDLRHLQNYQAIRTLLEVSGFIKLKQILQVNLRHTKHD